MADKGPVQVFRSRIKDGGFLDEKVLVLAEPIGDKLAGATSKSQLRKFYNSLKALEREREEDLKPQIMLLKAQIAYAQGRRSTRREFEAVRKFLDAGLDQVLKDTDRLDAFLKYLEIVYGFFYSRAS